MTASMKILFCLRAFTIRGNWGSQRALHTFANRKSHPTDRNLQKSAIFANALKGFYTTLKHTNINQYFNKIFKLLLLIVPKKRRPNFHNSNNTTDFEAAKNEIKRQGVSSEPNPNIEETKTIEKDSNSDVVTKQPLTEVGKIENEEIQNGSTQQNKNVNDVRTDTIVNEPESKYESEDSKIETKVLNEDDIITAYRDNSQNSSEIFQYPIRLFTDLAKEEVLNN